RASTAPRSPSGSRPRWVWPTSSSTTLPSSPTSSSRHLALLRAHRGGGVRVTGAPSRAPASLPRLGLSDRPGVVPARLGVHGAECAHDRPAQHGHHLRDHPRRRAGLLAVGLAARPSGGTAIIILQAVAAGTAPRARMQAQ